MITQILLFVLGLALLIKGAGWLVDGASSLARRHNVSDIAIGLTIVAFGTSAPELVVNSLASYQGYQDMVFGNVIGSNNFNLFIILGLTGLIIPLTVQTSTIWKEIPLSLIAAVIIFLMCNDFFTEGGFILTRVEGIILLCLFGLFLYYVYRQLENDRSIGALEESNSSNFKIWGLIIVGLAGLVLGGRLVVVNAIQMASSFGISERIVGLTIVAAGTSLPELATSITAAIKNKADIAVGNIIGSNIFNLFFILAISSVIRPIKFDAAFNADLYILIGGTLFLFLAMFTGKKWKLDRWEAGLLFIVFVAFTVLRIGDEL